MKTIVLALTCALLVGIGQGAYAGTIQITATGQASQQPDFAVVPVTVNSKCYKTSTEAKNANAALAAEVRKVMEPIAEQARKAGLKDPFTEVGGQFVRQTEVEYTETDQGKSKKEVLCVNGWRTSKTLSVKVKNVEALPEIQDAILTVVDKRSEQQAFKGPQTWADSSAPFPAVTPENAKALELKAMKDAKANAYRQLSVLVEECNLVNPSLRSVAPPGIEGPGPMRARAEAAAAPAPGGGHAQSSFTFEQSSRTVTLVFTFEFDGGLVGCPLPKK